MKKKNVVVLAVVCVAAMVTGVVLGIVAGPESGTGISESAVDTVSDLSENNSVSIGPDGNLFTNASAGSSADNGSAAADASSSVAAPTYTTAAAEKSASGITLLPTPTVITMNPDNWELTLLNIYYKMDESYEPTLAPAISGSSEQLDYRVAPYYQQMYDAAKAAGADITPCSGYRSYALQTKNYNRKIQSYLSQGYTEAESEALAAQAIMPPGCSEHNYGLCMDIGWVDESFESGSGYAWLVQHAADYGFILRYPKDKTDITKVEYEPWHWRYVGVENAKAIKASGLCLEEYLGKVN